MPDTWLEEADLRTDGLTKIDSGRGNRCLGKLSDGSIQVFYLLFLAREYDLEILV